MRYRIAVVLLLSCLPAYAQDTNSPLWKVYFAASLDARDAQPWKISRNLVAITSADKHLVWKKGPNGDMVKVVTWVWYTSASDPETYQVGSLAADSVYNDSTLIWVTALKTFCTDFAEKEPATELTLRIQQILGLPPTEVARSEFAEFWVRPTDLIRPAPNPEISDHEAELDFPSRWKSSRSMMPTRRGSWNIKALFITNPFQGRGPASVTPTIGEIDQPCRAKRIYCKAGGSA
jgi:hypothetical protein